MALVKYIITAAAAATDVARKALAIIRLEIVAGKSHSAEGGAGRRLAVVSTSPALVSKSLLVVFG